MIIEGCLTTACNTTITPATGTFLMFPSWLKHSVTMYCEENSSG